MRTFVNTQPARRRRPRPRRRADNDNATTATDTDTAESLSLGSIAHDCVTIETKSIVPSRWIWLYRFFVKFHGGRAFQNQTERLRLASLLKEPARYPKLIPCGIRFRRLRNVVRRLIPRISQSICAVFTSFSHRREVRRSNSAMPKFQTVSGVNS